MSNGQERRGAHEAKRADAVHAGTVFHRYAGGAGLSAGSGPGAGRRSAGGVGGAGRGGARPAVAAAGPAGPCGLRRDDGHRPEFERGVLRGHRGFHGPAGQASGRHDRPAVLPGLSDGGAHHPAAAGPPGRRRPNPGPVRLGTGRGAGHPDGGHGRHRRRPAGLFDRLGLQPDLREKVPPRAAAHLRGRPLVVLVHDGGVGRAGAGLLLCVAAHPAGGGRPHRVDRRGRGCGAVPLRLFGAGFDPHRPAPSDLHPVPVQFGGRHFDGGGARLYRGLRRPDGRVQYGAALFGQHPLDVHRLYQDLRLFWDAPGPKSAAAPRPCSVRCC